MEQVKVSVVIPIYNVEEYVGECLDSLVNQTLKEIEIICVDDGSTDHSVEILKRYSEQDERIKVIQQKNLYAGVARNNGLKEARGEYVIFLDSDDFFEKEMLEETYQRGVNTTADIVLFGGRKYNTTTKEYLPAKHFFNKGFLKELEIFSRKDIPERIMTVSSPAPWTKLFRRQFVLENGLEFQNLSNSNDAYFTLTAMCLAEKIAYVDKEFANYRIGMVNNIQSKKTKSPMCFFEAYYGIYDELVKRGIYSEVEKSFVEVFLSGCAYNLDTMGDKDIKLQIYREMQSERFKRTGVLNHPIEYYLNQKRALQLKEGCDCALTWHEKFHTVKKESNLRCLKENTIAGTPLVSVIIPVYNVVPYLKECLDSVKAQTLSDIEIICINDGSTDNSLEILLECSEDDRLSIYSQRNSGLSATRNVGVRQAKGKYIYFMDSDDILEVNALKEMYECADELNLDVVYCDGSSFSEAAECEAEAEKYREYYTRKHHYEGVWTGPALMKAFLDNEEYRMSACLQMIRREYFIENNLWFYEGILHEDNLFNFCCMLNARRTSHVNEKLFSRRVRVGSIMTSTVVFGHVYGYFCCFMKMQEALRTLELAAEEEKAALEILKRVLHNARNKYTLISEGQKQAAVGMTQYERMFFDFYIADFGRERMMRQNKDEQLQKVNKRLQTTFDEKAERGIKIKEQEKIIRRQRGEIAELRACTASTTYKIGKLIMFLPCRLKDLLLKIKNRF